MTELEMLLRAQMYMEKLAQGIDPITDRELPEDSPLHQLRLARCFFYVSGVLKAVIEQERAVKRSREFSITPEQLALGQPSAYAVKITGFAKLLHSVVNDPLMKQLQVSRITDWLLDHGYLMQTTAPDGKIRRVPTDKGRQIGMYTEHSSGRYGQYLATFYDRKAQQFLLDHFWEIMGTG